MRWQEANKSRGAGGMESRSPSSADGLIEKVASKTMRGRERGGGSLSSEWSLFCQGQRQRRRGKWTLGLFELTFKFGGKAIFKTVEKHRVPGGLESQVCAEERLLRKTAEPWWGVKWEDSQWRDFKNMNSGDQACWTQAARKKGNRHSKWANWGRMWESAVSTWLWVCMTFGSPLWWDHKSQEGRFFCLLMGL